MNLIHKIIHQYIHLKPSQRKIEIFNYVQRLPYQINGLSKPEQVIEAGAGYCVSKHRLLKELFKEIGLESSLCYVPFSFGTVQLPKNLQQRGMAKKDWYHVFLQCIMEGQIVYLDASFPLTFSNIYPTSTKRDGINSMTPFGGPYENIMVCSTKEDEKSATTAFTKNTKLDTEDEKRIQEFNIWSLNYGNQ